MLDPGRPGSPAPESLSPDCANAASGRRVTANATVSNAIRDGNDIIRTIAAKRTTDVATWNATTRREGRAGAGRVLHRASRRGYGLSRARAPLQQATPLAYGAASASVSDWESPPHPGWSRPRRKRQGRLVHPNPRRRLRPCRQATKKVHWAHWAHWARSVGPAALEYQRPGPRTHETGEKRRSAQQPRLPVLSSPIGRYSARR